MYVRTVLQTERSFFLSEVVDAVEHLLAHPHPHPTLTLTLLCKPFLFVKVKTV